LIHRAKTGGGSYWEDGVHLGQDGPATAPMRTSLGRHRVSDWNETGPDVSATYGQHDRYLIHTRTSAEPAT
jgi:hypothetical protein